MRSPFSLGHGDEFNPPAVPSDIFPDEDARDAAMCDAGVSHADVDDDSIGNDSVDSDDDGSAGDGGTFPSGVVGKWQDVDYDKPPKVFVDEARDDVFNQFLEEHSFLRGVINNIDKNKDNSPVDKITSLLYGPKSDVFRVFADHLDLSYEQFSRFLASFYKEWVLSR